MNEETKIKSLQTQKMIIIYFSYYVRFVGRFHLFTCSHTHKPAGNPHALFHYY